MLDDTGAGQALRTRLPRFVNEVADDPLLLMALGFAAEAVADLRAATPTDAAKRVVPDVAAELEVGKQSKKKKKKKK